MLLWRSLPPCLHPGLPGNLSYHYMAKQRQPNHLLDNRNEWFLETGIQRAATSPSTTRQSQDVLDMRPHARTPRTLRLLLPQEHPGS